MLKAPNYRHVQIDGQTAHYVGSGRCPTLRRTVDYWQDAAGNIRPLCRSESNAARQEWLTGGMPAPVVPRSQYQLQCDRLAGTSESARAAVKGDPPVAPRIEYRSPYRHADTARVQILAARHRSLGIIRQIYLAHYGAIPVGDPREEKYRERNIRFRNDQALLRRRITYAARLGATIPDGWDWNESGTVSPITAPVELAERLTADIHAIASRQTVDAQ